MHKKELSSICTFYAVSPVHAGCGASTAAVDLPIQRERHTNWPHIQASAVKGAMRAHYRKFASENNNDIINLIFGSDNKNDEGRAGADDGLPGAVAFSDAKLLAFPMRSSIAPFVWVTSPAVLKRISDDLAFVQLPGLKNIPALDGDQAVALKGNITGSVILEDTVVSIMESVDKPALSEGFPEIDKLLVVSDEVFDYCVSSCTEIQTQIKIDSKTGTAADGALRYQELLPADSVLYSVLYYSKAGMSDLQAVTIKDHIEDVIKGFMQIGGDETLGRGICKIFWINGGNQ